MKQNEAETLALKALNFLASDEERLERFMSLTGMGPQTLRNSASDPAVLAGVLDYLLQDETLVYMLASELNITPDQPSRARRVLMGGEYGDYN